MTDPTEPGPPGTPRPTRGRRGATGPGDHDLTGAAAIGSPERAIGMGAAAALVLMAVYLIMASVLSFSAGLVVVALFTGRFIGLFVKAGAGSSVSSAGRTVIALVIFLVGLTVTLVAVWLVAGLQGGVLPLGAFLDDTYGTPIVALQFMLGTLMTWWSAR